MVKKPITVLVGNEVVLRDEAIHLIKARLFNNTSAQELNTHVFTISEHSLSEIITQAQTVPFLARKRLLTVKSIEKLKGDEQKAFLRQLQNTSESCEWILISEESRITKSSFFSALVKIARVVQCRAPFKDTDIKRWVASRLSGLGKAAEVGVIDLMLELVGPNLTQLASRSDQLALFTGNRRNVSCSDVQAVVGESAFQNAFYLYDALAERKFDKAYKTFKQLQDRGSKPQELLGGLIWQFNRKFRIKNMLARGMTPVEISDEMGLKGNFIYRELERSKAMSSLRAEKELGVLIECDSGLKHGQFEPDVAVEKVLLGLYEVESAGRF